MVEHDSRVLTFTRPSTWRRERPCLLNPSQTSAPGSENAYEPRTPQGSEGETKSMMLHLSNWSAALLGCGDVASRAAKETARASGHLPLRSPKGGEQGRNVSRRHGLPD
jgi:hypothetical protein